MMDTGSKNSQDVISTDEEEEEEEVVTPGLEGAVYENLNVTPDVKELFPFIGLFTPRTIDLDVKLKPFIPDYIPAVGDVDPFIKVPRPDGGDDQLGLTVLDEPSVSKQSDVTLLSLKLKALNKDINVRSSVNTDKIKTVSNAAEIDSWVESIRKLRQETSLVTTSGNRNSRNQSDIESLMQEWDPDFEHLLNSVSLPPPDIDCSLEDYVSIICALLDIPVHGSKISSLQTLFSLYNEFRTSQHFKNIN